MESRALFDENDLWSKLPKPEFAITYWSGAFPQEWYTEKDKPMIDFIFWVENPAIWHYLNIANNADDYSFWVWILWIDFIKFLQSKWAWIYYNPFVKFNWWEIKYWVISLDEIIQDLNEWTSLYVAGRLHKVVKLLSTTPEVDLAIQNNLEHAFKVALLMLPEVFTKQQLFETITWISYTWDSRMRFWENPRKVSNIVSKNPEWFDSLYKPTIKKFTWELICLLNDNKIERNFDPLFNRELIKDLPKNLLWKFNENRHQHCLFSWQDYRSISNEQIKRILTESIAQIVKSPSLSQTTKWIITAWPIKSIRYWLEKRSKAKK